MDRLFQRLQEEDKTKEDLVHVLEPVDYVEYSYDETANCTSTSKSKKCQDHFKDQFDGDFYDYDTWTEPPDPKDQEKSDDKSGEINRIDR